MYELLLCCSGSENYCSIQYTVILPENDQLSIQLVENPMWTQIKISQLTISRVNVAPSHARLHFARRSPKCQLGAYKMLEKSHGDSSDRSDR